MYVDLNTSWSTWDTFVCDQPFDSVESCVGNIDNVLHNFESTPCLTQAFIDIDSWKF